MIYYNKSIRYIFIILGLNFACAIGYIGNILVEGNYSFVADLSILISLIYILFLPFIGYVLHAFLRKRVALKLNKVVLDDLAEFEVLSDKKLKNNPSLEIEDKEYRSKFIRTANSIGDYNKVFEIIKLNYFIIFAFCTIAIVSNFKQFNIETYAILETSFFILLSLILYFLSIKRENKIKNMLNKYKVSSGLLWGLIYIVIEGTSCIILTRFKRLSFDINYISSLKEGSYKLVDTRKKQLYFKSLNELYEAGWGLD